jgi:hypothetical protein
MGRFRRFLNDLELSELHLSGATSECTQLWSASTGCLSLRGGISSSLGCTFSLYRRDAQIMPLCSFSSMMGLSPNSAFIFKLSGLSLS